MITPYRHDPLQNQTEIICRGGSEGDPSLPVVDDESSVDEEQCRPVVCRQCGSRITDDGAKIEVDGSHAHTFFNPAGIVFEIGCFKHAPGAIAGGEISNEFSWFAGYGWRLTLCSSCMAHLGWRFESDKTRFFGLILTKLAD